MKRVPRDFRTMDRRERVFSLHRPLDARPPEERLKDFKETIIPFSEERAIEEAARCIHCPHPAACVEACPVHNDIPNATWYIEQGQFIEAAELFRLTNPIPEVCGRVCPQEILCEGSCTLDRASGPVHIGALEYFAADFHRREMEVSIPVGDSTGRKVAVVGGGPAGVACAERLRYYGHGVTMFEARALPGGLIIYGIPRFKLSHEPFLIKMNDLALAGVEFVVKTSIGIDRSISDLFEEGYEAVFIGVGAGVDVKLNVPGEDLPGVYSGVGFLIRANVDFQLLPPEMTERPQVGRRVAVIGGGDTASDCLRTALRIGVDEAVCVYRRTENEMPGVENDRQLAKEEGAKFMFLTQPVKFIAGEDGRLTAMECIKTKLGEPDSGGRRCPIPVEGSNFIVEVDSVVTALGFHPYSIIGETTPGLETHLGGLIVIDEGTCATSLPGVFAGGDAVNGPDLVVTALADGRRAADSIHSYFQEKPAKQTQD